MKVCHKCKIEKQDSEFYKDKSRADGLCSRCKNCDSAACKAYMEENKEAMSDKASKRYFANKENELKKKRIRYLNNKEIEMSRVRAYQKKNPDIVLLCARNRRARIINADGTHTAKEVFEIFKSQRGICANCNIRLKRSGKNKYHVDHIIPLSKGGRNDKYNLQCLCPGCNIKKSAKHPADWAKENGRLL